MSKTILVTGASTGIGFDTVRSLTESGFSVIATVRQEIDRQNIDQLFFGKARAIILDVNNFAQVDSLPDMLKNLGVEKLYGLVNNAGIAYGGPFAHQKFSEIQSVIQTNVLALMKVTQVLIPLLQADRLQPEGGRIVNISSIAGISALPFLSVYAASKHAVEGLSTALRNELKLLKIKVIVVGPGSIQTPIWKKGFEIGTGTYDQTPYAESFRQFSTLVEDEVKHALPVKAVSDCVLDAMTSTHPSVRYEPIPRKWRNRYLQSVLPRAVVDYMTTKMLKLE